MVEIKEPRIADAECIAKIVNESLADPGISWREAPLAPAEVLSWIMPGPDQKAHMRVAVAGDQVLGYATLGVFKSDPGFEFTKELSIYVSNSSRGTGVGKALMTDALKPKGRVRQIISAIDAGNDSSVRLHKSFGFSQVGFLPGAGFTAGRPRDLILMMHALATN